MRQSSSKNQFRPDIQGLRAIAVLMVLVYHIWPSSLSGGYVGVDVFFVISGYLITGLLLREYESTNTISISKFYARRIKRLLPAATLVLVAIIIGSALWLPVTRLEDIGWEVLASAFYVENWLLAAWSVDYLAEDVMASPVQHFWTLSVEEQFYIVWPWLILATAGMAAHLRISLRKSLTILAVLIIAISLGHSISATAKNQELAFFITTTRVWELTLGALLALIPVRDDLLNRSGATFTATAGLTAIIGAAFIFSDSTAFPGYAALLPTVGTILLLVAGQTGKGEVVTRTLGSTPLQYIGNISYTLYLWHWPLIVFYEANFQRSPSFIHGLGLILISLLLSHLTYTYLESPIHHSRIDKNSNRKPFALAGGCVALCVALAVGSYTYVDRLEKSAPQITDPELYPGGAAPLSDTNRTGESGIPVIPNPLFAQDDRASVYDDGCRTRQQEVEARGCTYGDPEGDFHIVLAGDSYAAHWLPALEEIAPREGWKITVFNKSACILSDVTLVRWNRAYHECTEWNNQALSQIIELKPDLLLTGHFGGHDVKGIEEESARIDALISGYDRHWSTLAEHDIPVAAIHETPRMSFDGAECLATKPDPRTSCVTERQSAFRITSSFEAATDKNANASLISLNNHLCNQNECPAIIGNILVYRDGGHMTATFAKTLGPAFAQAINQWKENTDQENQNRSND